MEGVSHTEESEGMVGQSPGSCSWSAGCGDGDWGLGGGQGMRSDRLGSREFGYPKSKGGSGVTYSRRMMWRPDRRR